MLKMTRYAWIKADNTFFDLTNPFHDYDQQPEDLPLKGLRCLPAPITPRPTPGVNEIVEGPTYIIGPTEVTESYFVRAMTAEEIDASKYLKLTTINDALFKICFNMENRVRVLEGKQIITVNQYRTAIKALL
jgi:hypothetical protein